MKYLSIAMKVAVTLVAIYVVSRVIDRDALLHEVKEINPALMIFAVLISIAQVLVAAYRWRIIIKILEGGRLSVPSFGPYVRSFYIAQLFGQVMPFVAGDALRALLIHRGGIRLRSAVKSVLLDRAIALLVLFVVALPAILLSPLMQAANRFYIPILLFVLSGLVGATGIFIIARPLARFGARWRLISVITDTILDMRKMLLGGSDSLQVAGLGLAVLAISIVVFWILARGQHLPLNLVDAAAIVPLTLLVASIPISVAGWGIRESFVITLLLAAGLNSESALLLSLSFGTVLLIAALPGAVVLLFSSRSTDRNDKVGM